MAAYRLHYSDYVTASGPPDPAEWVGPPGPPGPAGPPGVGALNVINVLDHGAKGDGVTDDTAAIQAVLNTYSGKAIIFIPDTGSPFMTTGIFLRFATHLILDGTVKALPNIANGVVTGASVNNIIISGTGTIDGNSAAQATHPGGMAGLSLDVVGNARISGIVIRNAYHWNLNVTRSTNIVVDSVSMIGGGAANEFAAGCDDCWLTNCTIDGSGNGDYAFCFYGGVVNSGAIGNMVQNAGAGMASTFHAPGIGVMSDDPQPAPCHDIVIADNIIHDCGGPGLVVLGKDASSISTNVILANNRSYNNDKNGAGFVAGADVFIDFVEHVTVIGNHISKNGNPAGPFYTGIFCGPHAHWIDAMDNKIFDIGSGLGPAGGATPNAAFYMNNNVGCKISGNHIYNTNQTTPSMQFAMIGGVGSRTAIVDNFSEVAFSLSYPSDTIIANYANGDYFITDTRVRISQLNLSGLPTSATGLTAGDVWRNGTVLNIV